MFRIQFIWDEHNLKEIARHQITVDQAELAFLNSYPIDEYFANGDERQLCVGHAGQGQVLMVVIVERRFDQIRVVTA